MTLNGNATVAQVNNALSQLAQQHPLVRIFVKEIGAANPTGLNVLFGPDHAEHGACTVAAKSLVQSGTLFLLASAPNLVFSNTHVYQRAHAAGVDLTRRQATALERQRALHLAWEMDWHTYGVLVIQRQMYIYDPSFPNVGSTAKSLPVDETWQIGDFANLNRARDLVRAIHQLKGATAVQGIHIGGGGNVGPHGACRPMTMAWLQRTATLLQAKLAAGTPAQVTAATGSLDTFLAAFVTIRE